MRNLDRLFWAKKDSAPGMSGLSYNMLRVNLDNAPDVVDALYQALSELWVSKSGVVEVALTGPQDTFPPR